jgi:hypothetical protein
MVCDMESETGLGEQPAEDTLSSHLSLEAEAAGA